MYSSTRIAINTLFLVFWLLWLSELVSNPGKPTELDGCIETCRAHGVTS